jgi:hypothetical protein
MKVETIEGESNGENIERQYRRVKAQNSLVKHNQTPQQIRNPRIRHRNTEEQHNTARREVEQYQDHYKLPKARDLRVESR